MPSLTPREAALAHRIVQQQIHAARRQGTPLPEDARSCPATNSAFPASETAPMDTDTLHPSTFERQYGAQSRKNPSEQPSCASPSFLVPHDVSGHDLHRPFSGASFLSAQRGSTFRLQSGGPRQTGVSVYTRSQPAASNPSGFFDSQLLQTPIRVSSSEVAQMSNPYPNPYPKNGEAGWFDPPVFPYSPSSTVRSGGFQMSDTTSVGAPLMNAKGSGAIHTFGEMNHAMSGMEGLSRSATPATPLAGSWNPLLYPGSTPGMSNIGSGPYTPSVSPCHISLPFAESLQGLNHPTQRLPQDRLHVRYDTQWLSSVPGNVYPAELPLETPVADLSDSQTKRIASQTDSPHRRDHSRTPRGKAPISKGGITISDDRTAAKRAKFLKTLKAHREKHMDEVSSLSKRLSAAATAPNRSGSGGSVNEDGCFLNFMALGELPPTAVTGSYNHVLHVTPIFTKRGCKQRTATVDLIRWFKVFIPTSDPMPVAEPEWLDMWNVSTVRDLQSVRFVSERHQKQAESSALAVCMALGIEPDIDDHAQRVIANRLTCARHRIRKGQPSDRANRDPFYGTITSESLMLDA